MVCAGLEERWSPLYACPLDLWLALRMALYGSL